MLGRYPCASRRAARGAAACLFNERRAAVEELAEPGLEGQQVPEPRAVVFAGEVPREQALESQWKR